MYRNDVILRELIWQNGKKEKFVGNVYEALDRQYQENICNFLILFADHEIVYFQNGRKLHQQLPARMMLTVERQQFQSLKHEQLLLPLDDEEALFCERKFHVFCGQDEICTPLANLTLAAQKLIAADPQEGKIVVQHYPAYVDGFFHDEAQTLHLCGGKNFYPSANGNVYQLPLNVFKHWAE